MDWRDWLRDYDDPSSALSRRLLIVQAEIRAALDRLPSRPWQVISLCAGDGRDLLGVLADHPRRVDVRGRLVERDEQIAEAGRRAYAAAGLAAVEVRTGDAADPTHYRGLAADLLLVCGVMGNLTQDGVLQLIERLPALCAPGCGLVWTRHRRPPDLTPGIRAALGQAGFAEIAFRPVEDSWGSVGSARWEDTRSVRPLGGAPLFEFVADETQAWKEAPSGSGPPL